MMKCIPGFQSGPFRPVMFGAAFFLIAACSAPPYAGKPPPGEILAGAIETDLEWGAAPEEVAAMLRGKAIRFEGPAVDEDRVNHFPDEPDLWISKIETFRLEGPSGFGCNPSTYVEFRFSPRHGLYEIRREEAELCVDPW